MGWRGERVAVRPALTHGTDAVLIPFIYCPVGSLPIAGVSDLSVSWRVLGLSFLGLVESKVFVRRR